MVHHGGDDGSARRQPPSLSPGACRDHERASLLAAHGESPRLTTCRHATAPQGAHSLVLALRKRQQPTAQSPQTTPNKLACACPTCTSVARRAGRHTLRFCVTRVGDNRCPPTGSPSLSASSNRIARPQLPVAPSAAPARAAPHRRHVCLEPRQCARRRRVGWHCLARRQHRRGAGPRRRLPACPGPGGGAQVYATRQADNAEHTGRVKRPEGAQCGAAVRLRVDATPALRRGFAGPWPAAVLCRGRGSRLREADQCAAAKGATRGYIHRYAITDPYCPPYPPCALSDTL
jgi:hypothetical protein